MAILPASREAYQLLHEGSLAFARMEATGIKIDVSYLDKAILDVKARILDLEKQLKSSKEHKLWLKEYGNKMVLGSRTQLGRIIFDNLGHKRNPFMIDKNEKFKNNMAAFEHLRLPFIVQYREFEQLKKALSTNLLGIRREVIDGIVHPFFSLAGGPSSGDGSGGAESYRPSGSRPNFLNQPGRNKLIAEIVRTCVVPRKNHELLECDYSTQEVRGSYWYNKDPKLLYDVLHGDMHRDRCLELYLLSSEELGPTGSGTTGKDIRYCNPPEAPIWMGDLSFKPIGEIQVGDEVMGWVREGSEGYKINRSKKKLVKSTVTAVHVHDADIVRLYMESGRKIRCTPDHLWADGSWGYNNEKEVYTTPQVGKFLSHVIDPTPELPNSLQYDAGYLGAMMDGEGTANHMVISQSWEKNRDVCLRLEETAKKLGFGYSWRNAGHSNGCLQIRLLGGLSERVRLLNQCKPAKKEKLIEGIMSRTNFGSKDRIYYIKPDGYGKVIGLTTTTGNYIVWGYASKNCAKNLFVFREFYGGTYFQASPNLWDAISLYNLRRSDGTSIYEHLKSKGVKKLGLCDPEREPEKGTFEYVVKEVERKMWEDSYPVYADWKRKWWNQYLRDGGVNTLSGFRMEGVFRRNQVLCDPIQGVSFHCLLWTLIQAQNEMIRKKMKSRIVLQVYDSILCDVHKAERDDYIEIVNRWGLDEVRKHWQWITCPLGIDWEVCDGCWARKSPMKETK